MKIDELYFGIKLFPLSYGSEGQRKELKTYNLFDFSRIKWAVARYITMSEEERKTLSSPLYFCFGDVWSRAEFEFIVNTWPYSDDEKVSEGIKVDIWTMYIEPNKDYLTSLLDSVDKTSAQEYLDSCKK